MKTLRLLLPLFVLLTACQQVKRPLLSQYLNTGNLPQQSFTINPERDTTLTSSGGIRIHIDRGTFATGEPVTIEWKEALDFQSILKAGLTTQSGKEVLRSGGMFYFDTKEKLAIQKPVGIDVPTETIASGMQLYKGDSSSGKLDWKEPKGIENPRQMNQAGKILFSNNCASCHRIDRELTGPGLSGITERRSKQWLYAVTRNTAAMAAFDPVICCQKKKYGVVMQSFPGLSMAEMDSIYDFIGYETEKSGGKGQGFGCDNCAVTNPAYDSLLAIYNQQYYSGFPRDSIKMGRPDTAIVDKPTDVTEGKTYYQVTIQSEGWYNIDALFKDWTSAVPSNLIVYPQGERSMEIEYYLAIPAMKILVNGTVQNKGETVVFNEASGQIPLPQQRGAFIIAVGGAEGKYFFVKKDFITTSSQVISLPIQKILKQQFDAQMKELTYYGLNAKVEDTESTPDFTDRPDSTMIVSEYTSPLTGIEMQLRKLTAKKMRDCGCDQLRPRPATKGESVYDYVTGATAEPTDLGNDTTIYDDKPRQ